MGRQRQGRAVWAERVRRWRESGLTGREFAAQLGVNANTLAYWRYRLGSEQDGPQGRCAKSGAVAPLQFVELVSAPAAAGGDDRFEIGLADGRVVRVPPRFEDATLRRLLAIAEGR